MLRDHSTQKSATTERPDYYAVPRKQLSEVHYSKISKPARTDIYVMKRRFLSEAVEQVFEQQLTERQRSYRQNGCLVLRNFIPADVIDTYLELRQRLGLGRSKFADPTAHVEHPEILDLVGYKPLIEVIRELHECEMGLIFTVSDFESTNRGWHQDSICEPSSSLPRIAAWIACGKVDATCGPFEYIPGSHRWMTLNCDLINQYLKPEFHGPLIRRGPGQHPLNWGRITEPLVDSSVVSKMARDGVSAETFIAEKGDVLLFYGRVMHRGSAPTKPGAVRPSLIAHYVPLFEPRLGSFGRHPATGVRYYIPPHKSNPAIASQ